MGEGWRERGGGDGQCGAAERVVGDRGRDVLGADAVLLVFGIGVPVLLLYRLPHGALVWCPSLPRLALTPPFLAPPNLPQPSPRLPPQQDQTKLSATKATELHPLRHHRPPPHDQCADRLHHLLGPLPLRRL